MIEGLPDALHDLASELRRRGYAAIRDEASDSFGDRIIEFFDPSRAAGRRVRLVKDRGLWDVAVEIGGEWQDPFRVLLALDRKPYSTRALNHEERRVLTLTALDRLPDDDDAVESRSLRDALQEFRRAYWRRYGVDGD